MLILIIKELILNTDIGTDTDIGTQVLILIQIQIFLLVLILILVLILRLGIPLGKWPPLPPQWAKLGGQAV